MKTKFQILIIAIVALLSFNSCNKIAGLLDDKNSNTEQTNVLLQGTKWKLEGIVNDQTGEMQVLEPVDCEECYTLMFETNSTAHGISVINSVILDLSLNPTICIPTFADDHEIGDVQVFYDATKIIDSFKTEESNLKLFYNDKKNYLLYKLKQQ